MADYQKMYDILCIAADRALDCLAETAENAAGRKLLADALLAAEDLYIREGDAAVTRQIKSED